MVHFSPLIWLYWQKTTPTYTLKFITFLFFAVVLTRLRVISWKNDSQLWTIKTFNDSSKAPTLRVTVFSTWTDAAWRRRPSFATLLEKMAAALACRWGCITRLDPPHGAGWGHCLRAKHRNSFYLPTAHKLKWARLGVKTRTRQGQVKDRSSKKTVFPLNYAHGTKAEMASSCWPPNVLMSVIS